MRYTRMKKFRNRHSNLVLMIKILSIWYISIITATYLTTDTVAYFNDIEQVNGSIHVKWDVEEPDDSWDNSSLDFDNGERGGSCEPPYVFAEIYNSGEDMTTSIWSWELYEVGKGNQSKVPVGPSLAEGEVPNINGGEMGIIETPDGLEGLRNGDYRFKVTKPERPGQPEIWSGVITISDCVEGSNSTSQESDESTAKEGEGGPSGVKNDPEPTGTDEGSSDSSAADQDESEGTNNAQDATDENVANEESTSTTDSQQTPQVNDEGKTSDVQQQGDQNQTEVMDDQPVKKEEDGMSDEESN